MDLFKLWFIPVRLEDVIDIALTTILIYQLYAVLRKNVAFSAFSALLALGIFWKVVDIFDLVLLKSILDQFLGIGTLAMIVLFAPEIRRIVQNLGKNTIFERIRLQVRNKDSDLNIKEMTDAITELSATRTGAIILLLGETDLKHIEQTGDSLKAEVSKRLLISIFNKYSPLHDGAVLIQGNQLLAARCVLPISDDSDLPPELGMRHRASLGITEVSDAVAIIVSEQTGKISVAHHGKLHVNISIDGLLQMLSQHHFEDLAPHAGIKMR